MEQVSKQKRLCPLCGNEYTNHPAISREDNNTLICPNCGIRQSLKALGVSEDEMEEFFKIIPNFNDNN